MLQWYDVHIEYNKNSVSVILIHVVDCASCCWDVEKRRIAASILHFLAVHMVAFLKTLAGSETEMH
jgi:hypothetical protein